MVISREKWKVYGDVFDIFTIDTLRKLEAQGYFTELVSSLSQGKEAHIFTAKKADDLVIIKIYRLQNQNFNKMYNYIKADPRYQDLKGKKRQIIFAWAQREFRNLLKAREAGVRVPTPYVHLNNVIVMEFIEDNSQAAPQVKNTQLQDPEKFMQDVLHQMKLLNTKAKLIHGDLSMFNILNKKDKPVIIDMSQTTSVEDPNAQEYLERDITNIVSLASKLGIQYDEAKVLRIIQS